MNEKNKVQKVFEVVTEFGVKLQRFSCHLCELEFATKEKLKFHVENDHQ